MKHIFLSICVLVVLLIGCKQPKEDKTGIQEQLAIKVPEFSKEDKEFSYTHYAIAKDAIHLLKGANFDNFEALVAPEFIPKEGFENLEFMVNISDYIRDKNIAKQNEVKLEIGHNSYNGEKIPYKTYEFPFYDVVNKDTLGRSAILVTFADQIAKNKIVNLSFRDY